MESEMVDGGSKSFCKAWVHDLNSGTFMNTARKRTQVLICRGDKLELLGWLLCATQTEDKANEGLNWMYLRELQGCAALVESPPACTIRRVWLPGGSRFALPHLHPVTPFFSVGCLWDFWQFQNV